MKPRSEHVCLILICVLRNVSGQYYGDHLSYNDTDSLSQNDTDLQDDVLSREKRTLVFPSSSNLLLIFGVGTPLQLDRESIIVGAFTKMIYALPDNATYFTEPGVYYSRSSKSRWSIYKLLETATEAFGFGGKGCMLRTICEAAHVPFNIDHGLFGELVHTFLTPSSTNEEHDEYEDQDYHAAERLGRNVGENCEALYPECQKSILDIFSRVSY